MVGIIAGIKRTVNLLLVNFDEIDTLHFVCGPIFSVDKTLVFEVIPRLLVRTSMHRVVRSIARNKKQHKPNHNHLVHGIYLTAYEHRLYVNLSIVNRNYFINRTKNSLLTS